MAVYFCFPKSRRDLNHAFKSKQTLWISFEFKIPLIFSEETYNENCNKKTMIFVEIQFPDEKVLKLLELSKTWYFGTLHYFRSCEFDSRDVDWKVLGGRWKWDFLDESSISFSKYVKWILKSIFKRVFNVMLERKKLFTWYRSQIVEIMLSQFKILWSRLGLKR